MLDGYIEVGMVRALNTLLMLFAMAFGIAFAIQVCQDVYKRQQFLHGAVLDVELYMRIGVEKGDERLGHDIRCV